MSLTSVIRYVRAIDTSSATGAGKTGLVFSDFTAKYLRDAGTLTSLTTETITTLGTYQAPTSNAHIRIKELNSADPTQGIYEVHFHNDQVANARKKLWLFLSATGALIQPLEMDLIPPVVLADAVDHGGTLGSSTATLGLLRINVTGDNSDAAVIFQGGTGCAGLLLAGGDGTGVGISGSGLYIIAGADNGGGYSAAMQLANDGAYLALCGGSTDSGVIWADRISGDIVALTTGSGHGLKITAAGGGKHDIYLAGSGDIDPPLNVNIKKVNDVTVTGTGAPGDEWGP